MAKSDEPIDVFASLQGGGTGQKIKKVQQATDEAISRLDRKVKVGGVKRELVDVIDEADKRIAEAATRPGMTEEEMAGVREKILGSTLGTLRASKAQEEKDLVMAIYGMTGLLNQLDAAYADLGKESPEDLALIQTAKAAVSRIETQIGTTEKKWNIFWSRDRALAELRKSLIDAQAQVPKAEEEAKRRARQRLQDANIEQALGVYMARVEHVLKIMDTSRKNGLEMLDVVSVRKVAAFTARDSATKALEQWDVKVNKLQALQQEAEDKLMTLQKGSLEYSTQETAITGIRRELEEARTNRNNALVQANSKAEYAKELELDEVALQRLVGNLEAWIIQLQSAAEERQVTFQARLQAEKLLSDQDAADKLDQVGAEVDKRNRSRIAQIVVGADKARQAMLDSMPGRRRHLDEVQVTLARHIASARERDKAFLDAFKAEYGIDPLGRSEFKYEMGEPSTGA